MDQNPTTPTFRPPTSRPGQPILNPPSSPSPNAASDSPNSSKPSRFGKPNPKKNLLLSTFLVFTLGIGSVVGLRLVQQSQDIRQQASTTPSCSWCAGADQCFASTGHAPESGGGVDVCGGLPCCTGWNPGGTSNPDPTPPPSNPSGPTCSWCANPGSGSGDCPHASESGGPVDVCGGLHCCEGWTGPTSTTNPSPSSSCTNVNGWVDTGNTAGGGCLYLLKCDYDNNGSVDFQMCTNTTTGSQAASVCANICTGNTSSQECSPGQAQCTTDGMGRMCNEFGQWGTEVNMHACGYISSSQQTCSQEGDRVFIGCGNEACGSNAKTNCYQDCVRIQSDSIAGELVLSGITYCECEPNLSCGQPAVGGTYPTPLPVYSSQPTPPPSSPTPPSTPLPTPTPTPLITESFVCSNLNSSLPSPQIGDSVNFTCTAGGAGISQVTSYNFRYRINDQAWQTIGVSSSQPNLSLNLFVTQPGQYQVQCQACDAQPQCTAWDQL